MQLCIVPYTCVLALFNGRTWVFGESGSLIQVCMHVRNVFSKPSCKRECRWHGHYARMTGVYMRGCVDIARGLRRSGNIVLTYWVNAHKCSDRHRFLREPACFSCARGLHSRSRAPIPSSRAPSESRRVRMCALAYIHASAYVRAELVYVCVQLEI